MSQLSEKELSAINELLNEEELLVKKFNMLAQQTKDPGIKKEFESIAKKHQGHFNMLFEQLGQVFATKSDQRKVVNEMDAIYTEKEILGDALTTEKTSTCNYNTYSNECVHNEVRDVMLRILAQEHEIQNDVFNLMHERGLYPTPGADEKKLQETKAKFAQSVKNIQFFI